MPKDRRQIAMEVLYQKARVAAGFPMEDDEQALEFVGATWLEILDPIPDRWLNECFKLAAQDGKQVNPQEMIRAWSTLVNNGTVAASAVLTLPKGPACIWCNDSGKMYVTSTGQGLTWDERAEGYAMKKCNHGDVQQPIEYRDYTEPQTD